jgi:hypothetical protein
VRTEAPASPSSVSSDVSRPVSSEEETGGSWPDDTAESAFLSEARERGEATVAAKPPQEATDDNDLKPLPALNDLVERIPANIRETLDDLFRVKFTTVRRIPGKALKE